MPRTRVKICCISSWEEASLAIDYGADALGLVSAMPSGPGVIEDLLIADIARKVPPPVATFLLTSRTNADSIVDHFKITRTNSLQLVDRLEDTEYNFLKQNLPGVKLVQVVHVLDEASIDEALKASEVADALLLDSGNPNLKIRELGGTGRVHNWKISREIVEQSKVPVFLAGGLNPENVRRAIEEVGPFGLDICTGVRTDGKLDPVKLDRFFDKIYNFL
jgi:phosphoribosylanthranilate isomerase